MASIVPEIISQTVATLAPAVVETGAEVAVETAVVATEAIATAAPVAAAEVATVVPDALAASTIDSAVTAAVQEPTSVIAQEQIAQIATGEIFPANPVISDRLPAVSSRPEILAENDGKPLKTDAAGVDGNATKMEPEMITKKDPSELFFKGLDNKLKQIILDAAEGRITPKERDAQANEIQQERQRALDLLIAKFDNNEDLTPFERKVAEEGAQMRQLLDEVATAPNTFDDMEAHLQQLQSQYKVLSHTPINEVTADSEKARHNTALREYFANMIAKQAANMARYANIVGRNVNQYLSVNNSLETKIGVRGMFHSIVVSIGTGIRARLNNINPDSLTRQIAATGQMPA